MPESEDIDNWDTHSIHPYVSEFIRPLKGRKPGWEYSLPDIF